MEPRIHIFLSYRQGHADDLAARDYLADLCGQHGYELIYDESVLGEGDNLTRFMNDLASAPCVLILLSPEYFRSAYTLFELVRVHEFADMDKRFIFPLRATSGMNNYVITDAKNDCWLKNEAVRRELCDRLNEQDEGAAWERVLNAWNAVVRSSLDTVTSSIEDAGLDMVLKAKLGELKKTVKTVIDEESKALSKEIKSEVIFFLKANNIPLEHLKHKLRLAQNKPVEEEIAEALVKEQVGKAIGMVTGVVMDQENRLKTDGRWNNTLSDAEQICGWLLIGSVDPVWWFHHRLSMRHIERTEIKNQLTLENHAYAEVIISRSIPRNASYRLNNNKPVPLIDTEINAMVLFDASGEAIGSQILSDIYKDLFKQNRNSRDTDESIIDEIHGRVYATYMARGKPVCYLLSRDILNQLEEQKWYNYAKQRLTGYLQFIYCELHSRDEAMKTIPSSTEDQNALLGQIAYLLSFRNR